MSRRVVALPQRQRRRRPAQAPGLPDSWAGYPASLAELAAERAGDHERWQPRDALICLLRAIDEGRVEVDDLMIVAHHPADSSVSYWAAGPGRRVTQCGMLTRILHILAA